MAINNISSKFKNAHLTFGSKFIKCNVCGEIVGSKKMLRVKSVVDVCVCEDCIKELYALMIKE